MSYLKMLLIILVTFLSKPIYAASKCGPMGSSMNNIAAKYFSQGRQLPVGETQSMGQKLYRSSFNKGYFQGDEAYVRLNISGENLRGKIVAKNTDGSIVFSYLAKNGKPIKVRISDNEIIESGSRLTDPGDINYVRKRIDEDTNIDRMTASEYAELRKKAAGNAGQRTSRETGEQARASEDSTSSTSSSNTKEDKVKESEEYIKRQRQRQKQKEAEEARKKAARERAQRMAEEQKRREAEERARAQAQSQNTSSGSAPKIKYVSGNWAGSRVRANGMHERVFRKAGESYYQTYEKILELHNRGQRPSSNPEMKKLYKKLYQVVHPDKFKAKYPNQREDVYQAVEEIFKDIDALRTHP